MEKAATYSEKQFLVTFGVQPVRAETGYDLFTQGRIKEDAVCLVEEFIEKPQQEIAQKYVDSGRHLWNSGMFIFQASSYLNELNESSGYVSKNL